MANYLGLDVGTTNIKAVLLNIDQGQIIAQASKSTPYTIKEQNTAELSPEQLYRSAVECIGEVSAGFEVDGLGISSFAEAGLPLNKNGTPLFPVIAWFDNRSQTQVNQLLEKFPEAKIYQITGQKPGFSFGLFKFLWIKENFPDVTSQMRWWLSVPDYILYRLTGEIFTDYTQASRTMVFDQEKRDWSDILMDYAEISREQLPNTVPSGTIIGNITKKASIEIGLPEGLPCAVGGHDHLCGAFACGGFKSSMAVDSSGSSQALLFFRDQFNPEDKLMKMGYVQYIHVVPNQYVIKGGLKTAGKALEWLREQMKITRTVVPKKVESIEDLIDQLKRIVMKYGKRKNGCYVIERSKLSKAWFNTTKTSIAELNNVLSTLITLGEVEVHTEPTHGRNKTIYLFKI